MPFWNISIPTAPCRKRKGSFIYSARNLCKWTGIWSLGLPRWRKISANQIDEIIVFLGTVLWRYEHMRAAQNFINLRYGIQGRDAEGVRPDRKGWKVTSCPVHPSTAWHHVDSTLFSLHVSYERWKNITGLLNPFRILK